MLKLVQCAAVAIALAVPIVVPSQVSSASTPPTLPPTETEPAAGADWERIVPGGDCACADGSEFNFWVRDADPAKVVLYLEGGGACFDATTCDYTQPSTATYSFRIAGDDDPENRGGIFDSARADNPFADYSVVYVPYCTGDLHLGHITREYSPELTVAHVGAVNGMAALGYLADRYGAAVQVVVVGESAGAVAAPLYGGLVSDLVTGAQVTVFADSSGLYPSTPGVNAFLGELWGSFANVPDWDVNEGLSPEQWGAPQLWVRSGLHDPEMVMSRFDHAYDETQVAYMDLLGMDTSDVAAALAANEAMIEEAGVVQHSYTAPGSDHTISTGNEFYEIEVDGVRLVDWLTELVAGEDVPDVRCSECGGSATASTG